MAFCYIITILSHKISYCFRILCGTSSISVRPVGFNRKFFDGGLSFYLTPNLKKFASSCLQYKQNIFCFISGICTKEIFSENVQTPSQSSQLSKFLNFPGLAK